MAKFVSALMFALLFAGASMQMGCADRDVHSENNDKSKAQADSTAKMQADSTSAQSKEKADEDRIPVEAATVEAGAISSYLLFSSNLETEEMADIYSRIQGLVEKINVEEGDYVKKGQVLMELEADEHGLAEEKARINYQNQEKGFQRAKEMFTKKLLSNEEYDQAKFALDAARIEWEQAKLNLEYTRITAPISGVIGERLCRPGDRIQPTVKLFSVVNDQEMIAVVYVPEKEIGNVRKGQKALITSDNLPGKQFPGWIKRVSPVVDPQSGTFKVTIGVRNAKKRLRPGMFVNAHIITEVHENAVLIPKIAILFENEYMNVFVVRDSVAHKVRLDAGFQDFEKVEALSGVEPGEQVIVVGQAGLKDQTPVRVVRMQ